MESKLLDMRDCSDGRFSEIHKQMLRNQLMQQPGWIRPLVQKSDFFKNLVDYDHWSRKWEYPWAVQAADLGNKPLRTLDVGGGGSPFAEYLAQQGYESVVIDPSLDQGGSSIISREKGVYRNIRSLGFWSITRMTGINPIWGSPAKREVSPVRYYPYSATDIKFPDNHFDRVFCLSVMEHIPVEIWPDCIKEFERVLKPKGRLIITLDMGTSEANERQYRKLIECCSLKLIGKPDYNTPISPEDKEQRHPGHTYETMGLVWKA